MAVVVPFKGVRYNPDKIKCLEDVVTPPYDVISAADGNEFKNRNPYSMINLDLRNTSQDETEDDGRYGRARDRFVSWQEQEILIRDDTPALYLYFIEYTLPSGRQCIRKGLVSLVELAEFAEEIVKPHEKTFSGVISDRLELMEACQAQFSQIFSLYSDPAQEIMRLLEKKREPDHLCRVKDSAGNVHTLWRVVDEAALAQVNQFFAERPVYIADGHHRYTTALDCRRRAKEQTPDLAADSPYNFVMMYLCACEDPGLSVLPTHRLVNWPGTMNADRLAEILADGLDVTEVTEGSRETLIGEVLNQMDEANIASDLPAFGVYHAGEDRAFLLRINDATLAANQALKEKPAVLRDLDVVVLSDLLIHGYLGLDHDRCVKEQLVSYYSDADDALDASVKMSVLDNGATPLLFLLNPTRVTQVTGVADQGEIMPHKSTYFYPKIMTGLLINKLAGDERVTLPAA